MFDLGWSELMIIAVVAIIVVGPKDLPQMLRTLGRYVGQAKRMANEFTSQFQDALKDEDLENLRKDLSDIQKADPLGDLERSVNKDLDDFDRSMSEEIPKPPDDAFPDETDEGWEPGEEENPHAIVPPAPFPNNAPGYVKPKDTPANENASSGSVAERAEKSWKAASGGEEAAVRQERQAGE